ncbi:MAG: SAM-dependent chlorinase/fluorinase [Synechocystis sp.]|nr:SAM-dependent chlorinase/fluorinase [Synechocystis sp.]
MNQSVDQYSSKVPAPIVLLSDFGDQDSYVGVMKGVIATLCPWVRCLDLTHAIPSQQVRSGSFCLQQASAYFPPGSIFLCVVDPEVGSQRRAISVECDRYIYVGPDNGLGWGLWRDREIKRCVELTNPDYWWNRDPSRTFHGRDIFAPVAAHLARGIDLSQLGQTLDPASLVSLPASPLTVTRETIAGTIDYIDRFGNLISNIAAPLMPENCTIIYHDCPIPWGQTYADRPPGQVLALIGSHGFLEIAVNGGNAQAQFNALIGDRLTVIR